MVGRRLRAAVLAMGALALPGCETLSSLNPLGRSGPAEGQPGFVRGFLGAIVTEDPAAGLAGRQVLSAGGTAGDAAVAAGFILAVTLPSRAGLGGGGACLAFGPAATRGGGGDHVPAARRGGSRPGPTGRRRCR